MRPPLACTLTPQTITCPATPWISLQRRPQTTMSGHPRDHRDCGRRCDKQGRGHPYDQRGQVRQGRRHSHDQQGRRRPQTSPTMPRTSRDRRDHERPRDRRGYEPRPRMTWPRTSPRASRQRRMISKGPAVPPANHPVPRPWRGLPSRQSRPRASGLGRSRENDFAGNGTSGHPGPRHRGEAPLCRTFGAVHWRCRNLGPVGSEDGESPGTERLPAHWEGR